MKIEIDLNDIFGDPETGERENLSDSIRRQVTDRLIEISRTTLKSKIDEAVAESIRGQIEEVMKTKLPALMEDLMDAEYTPVDTFGRTSKEPTSVRNEIVKVVQEQCKYERTGYNNNRNAWTRSVDDAVDKALQEFKAAWNAQVTKDFTDAALKYAADQLSKKLGVPDA